MSRFWAVIFTIALLLLSLIGLWKGSQGQLLFGSIKLSLTTTFIHGLLGVLCLAAIFLKEKYFHLIFQIVGVLFALWAGAEFLLNEDSFGISAQNLALAWTHVVFSVAALIEGFSTHKN